MSCNDSLRAFALFALLTSTSSLACSRVPSPLTPAFRGSVGLPYAGVLTEPVRLPKNGPGYRCINPSGQHFGTAGLVEAVKFAADRVQSEMPGPTLLVGDLSGEQGGEIPHHRSHRNGRDADLLFYIQDLSGAPIESLGWTQFQGDGIGRTYGGRYVQYDVARNWLLVKALLEAPTAQVLWLFVSRPVEGLITEYAIARGEDPIVVWEAENVMLQPTNALPHDDHFHLRVACPPDMSVAGCEDGGPHWPWFENAPSLQWPAADEQISAFLGVDSLPPL